MGLNLLNNCLGANFIGSWASSMNFRVVGVNTEVEDVEAIMDKLLVED